MQQSFSQPQPSLQQSSPPLSSSQQPLSQLPPSMRPICRPQSSPKLRSSPLPSFIQRWLFHSQPSYPQLPSVPSLSLLPRVSSSGPPLPLSFLLVLTTRFGRFFGRFWSELSISRRRGLHCQRGRVPAGRHLVCLGLNRWVRVRFFVCLL